MAKTPDQKPTIELFMYSLHQEFPEGVSHESFIKREVETRDVLTAQGKKLRAQKVIDQNLRQKASDWPAQWLHAKWVTDHTKAITGIFEAEGVSPLGMALTREEDFGGIIYDPFSDKVYKVNPAGLELFRALQSAVKRGESPDGFKHDVFKAEDQVEFFAFLRGAGLWEA